MQHCIPSPPRRFRLRRLPAFFRFLVLFLWELIWANLQVAATVLFRPVTSLSPGFVEYPIKGLSNLEIVILSHCITLTPGTTSVEVTASRLLLHALDAHDPQAVRESIKQNLEKPLLAWSR